jgi:hypothetical protein
VIPSEAQGEEGVTDNMEPGRPLRCTCITPSGQIVWDRNCPERLQNQVRLSQNPYRKTGNAE